MKSESSEGRQIKRIEFIIPGTPQVKQRIRCTKRGHVYTPTETRDYENEVALICMNKYPQGYFEKTALEISVYAGFETPKKAKHKIPTEKDLDNIIKIVWDGLNKVAYDDDAFIGRVRDSRKFYADKPGVLVVIQPWLDIGCPEKHRKYFY